jgi:hypothetical protein
VRQERRKLVVIADQRFRAFVRLVFVLADVDPPAQPLGPLVDAGVGVVLHRHFGAAEAREIQRILRHVDQALGRRILRDLDLALLPQLVQVVAPRLLQALEEQVRTAQQQHARQRRVALRQRREVLVDDRLVETGDDLLDRHARLHQRVRIGLGEDPALGADLVQVHAVVLHLRELLARDPELARGLLDERPGAAAAGRLHVHLLAGAAAGRREEHRLHVLAADLGHEAHFRMQFLDRGCDRDDFLHELAADQRRKAPGARAGEVDPVDAGTDAAFGFDAAEELEHHLGLARVVALVVAPQAAAVLHHDRLDGRRADVHPDELDRRIDRRRVPVALVQSQQRPIVDEHHRLAGRQPGQRVAFFAHAATFCPLLCARCITRFAAVPAIP